MENNTVKIGTVNNNNKEIISWMIIDVLEGRHYIGCDLMFKVKDIEQKTTYVRSVTIDPDVEEDVGSDLLFETFEEALLRVFLTDETLKPFIMWDDEELPMNEFSCRLDAFCTTHWISDDRIIFVRGE